MAFVRPSVADFKAHFTRDFPYGATSDTVMDSDIQKAIEEADFSFNEGLFSTQAKYSLAFLYLAAHYLVMDLRASSQGIAGQYSWLLNSHAVGSVSESVSIPQRILDNPVLAMLTKTNYGAKYINLILPLLAGNVYTICGATQP